MTALPEPLNEFKTRLFDQFGRMGRSLSSPKRLELLDLLCQAERSVDELCRETGLSPSNVSQHLRVLKEAHLVASRQEGLHHLYSLADPTVAEFWRGFRRLAVSRLPAIREILTRYFQNGEGLEEISPDELEARMNQGDVVVLDVRPEREYSAGHLPGARSLPLVELVRRLDEIPSDRELVAYCRGPYCVMASEAARLLKERGYRVRRLDDGVQEWEAQGRPIER